MPTTHDTCQERVSDGPRSIRFHPCGRPVKEDGLCGLHLAAKRRREANDEARRDYTRQQNDLRVAAEERVAALAAVGISAQVHYSLDFGRQRSAYTGGVVLKGADVDELLSTLLPDRPPLNSCGAY